MENKLGKSDTGKLFPPPNIGVLDGGDGVFASSPCNTLPHSFTNFSTCPPTRTEDRNSSKFKVNASNEN